MMDMEPGNFARDLISLVLDSILSLNIFEGAWRYLKMRFSLLSVATLLGVSGALVEAQCPDYTTFSQSPQGNVSTGSLKLPFMRPAPACRTFNSSSVEKVITDMKARLKDPDLARLFENTFPNTLDTTVRYFNETENLAAQWLRDTANQFAHYHSLLGQDKELATLVKAVINNEARYVSQYPYCGAFQPPPESDGVTVNPPVNNQTVFECKYELDSLCGFLKLSRSYYQATNDAAIFNDNWHTAISQIFRVIQEQSQPTFDDDFNFISFYNWTGGNGALSPAVPNAAFLTPANAMLSVELGHLADILDAAKQSKNVSSLARQWSSRIHNAIWNTTVCGVFFDQRTRFGGRYVMDDANVPSLLSLPYLGFLDKTNPAYVATRKLLLSRQNPYYSQGKTFRGIGGPHVDVWHPWPMSQISSIFGTDNDEEITTALYLIANNTAGLGLIHESINIYNASSYTRPWFAWANSYFAEMLLDLADRKPHLIFHDNRSYVPGRN
ncbi:Six-hairpin glycosidase-like protein [Irpex lacteus]|nr:Six-hairpin glycosidase-like protein [Irpex lacteus]